MPSKTKIGIYIHIPFCSSRCDYCAFVSSVSDGLFRGRYVDALIGEIESYRHLSDRYETGTLYIGGGTPSMLTIDQLASILNAVNSTFSNGSIETTIECNPQGVDEAFCSGLADMGFNRLSLGIQSTSDEVLRRLGRRTNRAEIERAMATADKYFDNVSVDLMLGIPTLTAKNIKESIDYLASFESVRHFSVYCLTCEEGTALYERVERGEVILPTDDETAAQYAYAERLLRAKGYLRYEVSNFAREGYHSRHNSSYWQRTPYLGLGAGAAGYLDGKRYRNTSDIHGYVQAVERGDSVVSEVEKLTREDEIEEIVMLGLRTAKGVRLADLTALDYDILAVKGKEIDKLSDYIRIADGYLSIKPEYALVMNAIITELI